MTVDFKFNYAEYLSACRKLFKAPPSMKHLFGVQISSDNFQISTDAGPVRPFGQNSGWDLTYFAQGAGTPELTLGQLIRTFQGIEMRLPALSDYGNEKTFTLTFYDTQDRFLLSAVQYWSQQIVDSDFASSTVGRVALGEIDENDRVIIQALTTDGSGTASAPSWCLYGVFPRKITDVTGLNQNELTDILTFTVEFKYRYAAFGTVTQTLGLVPQTNA